MKNFLYQLRSDVGVLVKTLNQSEIALIETSRNMRAIVDKKFAALVDRHRWYAVVSGGSHVYAVCDIDGSRIAMQRLVLALATNQNPKEVKHVSFKNKLTLDCRLVNIIKKANRQSVMMNRKPKRNTSSTYKGAIKAHRTNENVFWKTQIKGPDGSMSIGSFENEVIAARAYDAAAALMFREAGYRNFPHEELLPDLLDNARNRIARFAILKAKKVQF